MPDPKASGNLDVTDSKDDEAKQQQVLVVAEEQGPEAALERATEESSSSPEELASVEAAGDQGDTRTRKQLWKAAIKLPMYSVAVVPLMVRSRILSFGHLASRWHQSCRHRDSAALAPRFRKACSRRHWSQLRLFPSCTIA